GAPLGDAQVFHRATPTVSPTGNPVLGAAPEARTSYCRDGALLELLYAPGGVGPCARLRSAAASSMSTRFRSAFFGAPVAAAVWTGTRRSAAAAASSASWSTSARAAATSPRARIVSISSAGRGGAG